MNIVLVLEVSAFLLHGGGSSDVGGMRVVDIVLVVAVVVTWVV